MSPATPAEVQQLRDALRRLDQDVDPRTWADSLPQRKKEEASFHDWARDPDLETPDKMAGWEDAHPNMKYYDATRASAQHRERWLDENAPGNVVLDYCCGRSTLGMMAAQRGAALVIGLDISPVTIDRCRARAAQLKLDNAYYLVADAENTRLPDASVDRVITAGCLHHLDLSYAFPELRRILKPGGRVYAIEALAYNPAIQLYRRMTPGLRTAFEKDHILSLKELKFARRFFDVENVTYFHLASIATTPLRRTKTFGRVLDVADAIDRAILKVPGLKQMAWQFSFELVKRRE